MKRLLLPALFVAVSVSLFASPTIESEVRARGDEFAAMWNKHDPKAMASMWAPDGDLMNPYGRFAKGRAEVEALFKGEQTTVFARSTYKNVKTTVRVLSSDMALAEWDAEVTGALGPDGKTVPMIKPHVIGLMKKSGGQWWIVTGRAFTFLPMPPMPAKK